MHIRALEPLMLGSWERECLSSYVHRLAEAHCVNVGALMQIICGSSQDSQREYAGWRSIDFGCGFSQICVEALASATGIDGLEETTLGSFARLCVILGGHRRHVAFCPMCLDEGVDCFRTAYYPLIWRLRFYEVCIKHRTLMATECPHCGLGKLRVFFAGGRNGCCSRCRRWLGGGTSALEAGRPAQLERSVCAAELVAVSGLERAERVNAETFLSDLCVEQLNENRGMLRRAMRATPFALGPALIQPTLDNWMAFCEIYPDGLLDLLPRRPIPASLGKNPAFLDYTRLRGRRTLDHREAWLRIEDVLRNALNEVPPSKPRDVVSRVSTSLTTSSVFRKYPELARAVARRYNEHRKNEKQKAGK